MRSSCLALLYGLITVVGGSTGVAEESDNEVAVPTAADTAADTADDDNEKGTCVLRCLMILRSLVRVSGVIIVFVSWDTSSDRVRDSDSVWVCVIRWRLDRYASTVITSASVIV